MSAPTAPTAPTAPAPSSAVPAAGESGPVDPRARVRLGRGAKVAAAVVSVLGLVVLIAGVTGSGSQGYLDPASPDPGGGMALAHLLEQQGVQVRAVSNLPAASVSADDPRTTLFVPLGSRLTTAQLQRIARPGAAIVVTDPDETTMLTLVPGVQPGRRVADDVRDAACDLRAARSAGRALTGGLTVSGGTAAGVSAQCYAVGGAATVLVAHPPGGPTVTFVGSGTAFTNDALAQDGNAALALNMLGSRPNVVWLTVTTDGLTPEQGGKDLAGLLPPWVPIVLAQLAVAVLVLALWRGRRLGPVVVEALPVDVRAAETTEGRARLYRRRGARDRAATHLRSAALARLVGPLGLPPGSTREAVAAQVAARAGWSPGDVAALLYGAAPRDDAGLVRLASDLDSLERQVRRP